MEATPGDREHGYDDLQEQEAYEQAQETDDEDAGAASEPDDPREPDDE